MKFNLFILPTIPGTFEERERLRPIGRNNDKYQQMLQEVRDLAQMAEDLVRRSAVDCGQLLLDFVGLGDVALVELVVLFHGPRRNAVQLLDRRERLGSELGERHTGISFGRGGAILPRWRTTSEMICTGNVTPGG